ncbi:TRAFs-binding domain-containing protein [Heliomicrobium undosum]|uniref:TRAFs-binding domain-containing protein n=1 Tax=Heliomicrobium undosum TaxID=121734 RepID=UPI001A9A8B6A|nr:TRAFs-binding domain-containing protein [Heliomicrobium undosum]
MLNADVVIADLSTLNANAFYELGVRHALKPYTTIAIGEREMKYPFDLNHTAILPYEHLGTDIGYDEAVRLQEELNGTILAVLNNPRIDSPVYTFLTELQPPSLTATTAQVDPALSEQGQSETETLHNLIEAARAAARQANEEENQAFTMAAVEEVAEAERAKAQNDFLTAKRLLKQALQIDANNAYLLQQLALVTYKSKYPNPVASLREALQVLEPLKPDRTTDPETLGLSGAIYKRLWENLRDPSDLERAIEYYEKGYVIKKDYYNGINYAFLLDLRGSLNKPPLSVADHVRATEVRRKVADLCERLIKDDNLNQRSDKYWVVATCAEAMFGLGNMVGYEQAIQLADRIAEAEWQRVTTKLQIGKLRDILRMTQL